MPFNSRTLAKMTSNLAFDDERARYLFGWAPRSVIYPLPEVLEGLRGTKVVPMAHGETRR